MFIIFALFLLPAKASIVMPRKKIYKCHEKNGFSLSYNAVEYSHTPPKTRRIIIKCPSNVIIGEDEFSFHGTVFFGIKHSVTTSLPDLKGENSIHGELYSEKVNSNGIDYYRSGLTIGGGFNEGLDFACNYWFRNTSFQISFEFDYGSYNSNLDCSLPETIMDGIINNTDPSNSERKEGKTVDFRLLERKKPEAR